MSYHRGKGSRWHSNNGNWRWSSQYGRFNQDSWTSQNSRESSSHPRDDRYRYNRQRHRNDYNPYSSQTDQRHHSSSSNKSINDIYGQTQINSNLKRRNSKESGSEKKTSPKVLKGILKTPSHTVKNDEQLVTSSNTAHSPQHILSSSDEEKTISKPRKTSASRATLADKLVSDLLGKRTPKQLSNILAHPTQCNKYKATFDALNKEKSLKIHSELHQKYPRPHPPPGNSTLINPADSVDLSQLPTELVEILGLGLPSVASSSSNEAEKSNKKIKHETDLNLTEYNSPNENDSILATEADAIILSDICSNDTTTSSTLEQIDQICDTELSQQITKLSPNKTSKRRNSNKLRLSCNNKDSHVNDSCELLQNSSKDDLITLSDEITNSEEVEIKTRFADENKTAAKKIDYKIVAEKVENKTAEEKVENKTAAEEVENKPAAQDSNSGSIITVPAPEASHMLRRQRKFNKPCPKSKKNICDENISYELQFSPKPILKETDLKISESKVDVYSEKNNYNRENCDSLVSSPSIKLVTNNQIVVFETENKSLSIYSSLEENESSLLNKLSIDSLPTKQLESKHQNKTSDVVDIQSFDKTPKDDFPTTDSDKSIKSSINSDSIKISAASNNELLVSNENNDLIECNQISNYDNNIDSNSIRNKSIIKVTQNLRSHSPSKQMKAMKKSNKTDAQQNKKLNEKSTCSKNINYPQNEMSNNKLAERIYEIEHNNDVPPVNDKIEVAALNLDNGVIQNTRECKRCLSNNILPTVESSTLSGTHFEILKEIFKMDKKLFEIQKERIKLIDAFLQNSDEIESQDITSPDNNVIEVSNIEPVEAAKDVIIMEEVSDSHKEDLPIAGLIKKMRKRKEPTTPNNYVKKMGKKKKKTNDPKRIKGKAKDEGKEKTNAKHNNSTSKKKLEIKQAEKMDENREKQKDSLHATNSNALKNDAILNDNSGIEKNILPNDNLGNEDKIIEHKQDNSHIDRKLKEEHSKSKKNKTDKTIKDKTESKFNNRKRTHSLRCDKSDKKNNEKHAAKRQKKSAPSELTLENNSNITDITATSMEKPNIDSSVGNESQSNISQDSHVDNKNNDSSSSLLSTSNIENSNTISNSSDGMGNKSLKQDVINNMNSKNESVIVSETSLENKSVDKKSEDANLIREIPHEQQIISKGLKTPKRSTRSMKKSVSNPEKSTSKIIDESPVELKSAQIEPHINSQSKEESKAENPAQLLQCNVLLTRIDISLLENLTQENKNGSLSTIENNCEPKSETVNKVDEKPVGVLDVDMNSSSTVQQNPEPDLEKISFSDHKEPVVALHEYNGTVFAASEDGCIYTYDTRSGLLLNCLQKHYGAITHLDINNQDLFTIGLDARLQCCQIINQKKEYIPGKGLEFLANLSGPGQTFCISWDLIYIGTRTGTMDIYDITKKKIVDVLTVANSNILSVVCTTEGPRKIILVATKEKTLSVRDAHSGLALREMYPPICSGIVPAIYCLSLQGHKIYCGTSGTNIDIFNYTSGEHISSWSGGRGAVCLRECRGVLFSGCYDGNVYAHRLSTGALLGVMNGPGKILLCIYIVGDKIMAGSKDKALVLWKIPEDILKHMT